MSLIRYHFKLLFLITICSAYSLFLTSSTAYAEASTITPMLSISQDKSHSNPLYNQTIGGKVFVWISTSAINIESVKFWLDDSAGEGDHLNIDRWPPFDLIDRKHKRHNRRPRAFDTTIRQNGEHSLLIEFVFKNGSSARMLTPFTIFNEANIPYTEQYRKQRLR